MGYTIIYDRRSIKLRDGNYILMLQTGSNNCWEYSRSAGRDVPEKYWNSLSLVGEKSEDIICSKEAMRERIAKLAKDYGNIAKSRNHFFTSEEELAKYLQGGLNRPYSLEEYQAAGNTLEIKAWDQAENRIRREYIFNGEEELRKKLKEYSNNPKFISVSINFCGREFYPINKREPREKKTLTEGFVITATERDGSKIYFYKKTSRQLKFLLKAEKARIFRREEDAQKYLDNLPAVKGDVSFGIESFSMENTNELSPEQSISEM